MILYLLAGGLAWTLTEYGMHHWNGHLLKGKTHFSREHLKHHARKDYFTPTGRKIVLGLTVTLSLTALGTPLVGLAEAASFALGLGAGYLIYEYVHWANHICAPRTAYGRWARRHHFSHHFSDARYNHGVTTPLWDLIFRTYRTPEKIKVPAKKAMGWLLTQEGTLRDEFTADYALRGRIKGQG